MNERSQFFSGKRLDMSIRRANFQRTFVLRFISYLLSRYNPTPPLNIRIETAITAVKGGGLHFGRRIVYAVKE